ncbi:ABC transporter permease [Raineya orbicola]|uniref:ABC-type antimicrobial peptide transport system permease component n=1 Tax=Raineya orbicola TaxID=2016530 RepID=A0A2N3IIM6_9BACT|nr:ABC transporter permease [Raineya orbicola]PKQ70146.1 ABC-type antimicrobial peptide transport system permease component [Raineya orbicola]
MFSLFLHIHTAWQALQGRKLRAFLAALGVTFAVASMVAILAISKGSQKELEQEMQLIGANTIIITPTTEKKNFTKNSRGLCLQDAENIAQTYPNLSFISPEIHLKTFASSQSKWVNTDLYGVKNDYFQMLKLSCLKGGFFNTYQIQNLLPVCVIGASLEKKLFGGTSALGKYIRLDDQWFKVIGVIQTQYSTQNLAENLGIHSTNLSVYIPIESLVHRFPYKKFIQVSGNLTHQLHRIVVQVSENSQLLKTAESLQRTFLRLHAGQNDVEIIVPEQILKEKQKTQRMLTQLLGAVTGIALLIGGIGIMNVMLTSVLERLKEIGIRKAVGAKQSDIHLQFLFESVFICFLGGLVGLILGYVLSFVLHQQMQISIAFDLQGTLIVMFVPIAIGIIFGWYPARKAALQVPAELLHNE